MILDCLVSRQLGKICLIVWSNFFSFKINFSTLETICTYALKLNVKKRIFFLKYNAAKYDHKPFFNSARSAVMPNMVKIWSHLILVSSHSYQWNNMHYFLPLLCRKSLNDDGCSLQNRSFEIATCCVLVHKWALGTYYLFRPFTLCTMGFTRSEILEF